MKKIVLTMAALALLEDLANGNIRRERVFREREDLLANDNWLKSRFRLPSFSLRPEKVCRIVTTCGVLHNVSGMHGIPLSDHIPPPEEPDAGPRVWHLSH